MQKRRVALEENEKDIRDQCEIGAVGIPERGEWEGGEGLILGGESIAEANMDEADGGPRGGK